MASRGALLSEWAEASHVMAEHQQHAKTTDTHWLQVVQPTPSRFALLGTFHVLIFMALGVLSFLINPIGRDMLAMIAREDDGLIIGLVALGTAFAFVVAGAIGLLCLLFVVPLLRHTSLRQVLLLAYGPTIAITLLWALFEPPLSGGLSCAIVAPLVLFVFSFWINRKQLGQRRLARNCCPKCEYSLASLVDAGCPECGWNRSTAAPQ
jgi:ssDNA-binding Zn-finger/Zn-ribbon topoisomerase 1